MKHKGNQPNLVDPYLGPLDRQDGRHASADTDAALRRDHGQRLVVVLLHA